MATRVDKQNVIEFESIVGKPHELATAITEKWVHLSRYRNNWIKEKTELINYVYATDTSTTSNKTLPWSNSTTTPKLAQLRDNLHANYMNTLFPTIDWVTWKPGSQESNKKHKKRIIKDYMQTKLRQSGFVNEASKLVADYILYGNVFAIVEYVTDYTVFEDGVAFRKYTGPRLYRISPYDIVFDPTASTFEQSPKIIKKLVNLGDIKKIVETNPEDTDYLNQIFTELNRYRAAVISMDNAEIAKSEAYVADGFSDIKSYYESGYVELLTFYGSIYDKETGEFQNNRVITVADRAFVLENKPIESWLGSAPIFHAAWRTRPDNLYGMGPLDNVVGLQYRIDHLENLKADVFDQIAWPQKKIIGDVEHFEDRPGERIYVGDDGDVQYLSPDVTALNASLEIDRLLHLMEEMVGAPREAMGMRSPGEKTAFEVSILHNASNMVFDQKTTYLETVFFEPILNAMLEEARRNMTGATDVESIDPETGATFFETITVEDIMGDGTIFPYGARYLGHRDVRVQNLQNLVQLKLGDPTIGVHLSGKRIAEILAEELNEPSLYKENIAIEEQLETAQIAEAAQTDFEEEQMALSGM